MKLITVSILSMENKELIFLLFLLVLLAVLFQFALYWRKRAGEACCEAARLASSVQRRIRYSRLGTLAGNKMARMIYAFSSPNSFSDYHPLQIFKKKKVPCVFIGFYFPKRHWKFIDKTQVNFTKSVLDFKDGQADGIDFFKKGIEILKPCDGTVVMFMPCSAWWKYWHRFNDIAKYIKTQCPELVSGFDFYKYLGERDCLHLTKCRSEVILENNFVIKENLAGRNVIVVDDIITSGKSLLAFKGKVEAKGGHLVGAIFLAKTYDMPGKLNTLLTAFIEELTTIKQDKPEEETAEFANIESADCGNKGVQEFDNVTSKYNYIPIENRKKMYRERCKEDEFEYDRVIGYDDGSFAFCYEHKKPGKKRYYTAIHIPKNEQKQKHIFQNLEKIIEADKHREPTDYELSLNDHPYYN